MGKDSKNRRESCSSTPAPRHCHNIRVLPATHARHPPPTPPTTHRQYHPGTHTPPPPPTPPTTCTTQAYYLPPTHITNRQYLSSTPPHSPSPILPRHTAQAHQPPPTPPITAPITTATLPSPTTYTIIPPIPPTRMFNHHQHSRHARYPPTTSTTRHARHPNHNQGH